MCGIWTQDEWKEATSKQNAQYRLLGEYRNETGETALMILDQYGDVANIYSQDGRETETLWMRSSKTDEQTQFAVEAMAEKGFTPIPAEQPRVPGIAELAALANRANSDTPALV